MEQIPWEYAGYSGAARRRPNFTGTLEACLRHWRDEMSPVDQVMAMIAMGGGRWFEPEELLRLAVKMPEKH